MRLNRLIGIDDGTVERYIRRCKNISQIFDNMHPRKIFRITLLIRAKIKDYALYKKEKNEFFGV